MKIFYSILSISLNATLNEKVGIGLFVSNGVDHFFNYSAEKLLILKNILDSEQYSFIKSYLKSLEKSTLLKTQEFFGKKEVQNNWTSESYLHYLSKYSTNMVQFSPPKRIDIAFNENNYQKLFEKFIFKNLSSKIKYNNSTLDIHTKVKQELFPKIGNRVNIEMTLTTKNFENLFVPIEIDFIGKNGIPVAGQTVNFDKKIHYLGNDINQFISLTKAIEEEGNRKGKYYVIGKEPSNKMHKNHSLWKHIKESDFLDFIDLDEMGIIEEYIQEKNVIPFFE